MQPRRVWIHAAGAIFFLFAILAEAFHLLHGLEFAATFLDGDLVREVQRIVSTRIGAGAALSIVAFLLVLSLRISSRRKQAVMKSEPLDGSSQVEKLHAVLIEEQEIVYETEETSLFRKRTERTIERSRRYREHDARSEDQPGS